jgi:hypothetical protein
MTVSSATARTVHQTHQAVSNYSFEFKVFHETELSVLVVELNFVVTPLILGQDYIINGLGHDQGGTVYLTPEGRDKAGTGLPLVLLRQMRFVQETDYSPHDVFPAEIHEEALDILTMICQELRELVGRAMIPPPNRISIIRLPPPPLGDDEVHDAVGILLGPEGVPLGAGEGTE